MASVETPWEPTRAQRLERGGFSRADAERMVWAEEEGFDSPHEMADCARIGDALIGALPEGYAYSNCPSEIVADLLNQVDALQAALREWKRPSCGGKKTYPNRSRAGGLTVLPCKVCSETGLHPVAAAALPEAAS